MMTKPFLRMPVAHNIIRCKSNNNAQRNLKLKPIKPIEIITLRYTKTEGW